MFNNRLIYDEQAQTGAELEELLAAYRKAIDVNIISSITDASGNILRVNDRFCEISKYPREELVGQNHRIINSHLHGKEFFAEMWKTIKSGNVWRGEIRNRAKDGSHYWVDTVIIPISTEEKDDQRFLSLRLLITDKKNAELERIGYTEKLRTMLNMTSHRVRSPMAQCEGLLAMLSSGKHQSPAEQMEIVNHMNESLTQLDAFTRELTNFMIEME